MDAKKIIGATAGVAAAAAAGLAVKKRMGAPTVYHVQPTDEGWAVQAEGAKRASSTHKTKKEAVTEGRSLATNQAPSHLVIHRVDGSIQDRHAYGIE